MNDRQHKIIKAALSYMLSNLDDVNLAFDAFDSTEVIGENGTKDPKIYGIKIDGVEMSPINEKDVYELTVQEPWKLDNSHIELLVHNDDGSPDDYFIGCVEVPPLTTAEEACTKLDLCWAEWRDEVPHPDSDSEFIEWLSKEHGWVSAELNSHHTLGT